MLPEPDPNHHSIGSMWTFCLCPSLKHLASACSLKARYLYDRDFSSLELFYINIFPYPLCELNQGSWSVSVKRHNTLGVLDSRIEGSDSNGFVKIVDPELFLIELVNEVLE